jgi:hypothetical protein
MSGPSQKANIEPQIPLLTEGSCSSRHHPFHLPVGILFDERDGKALPHSPCIRCNETMGIDPAAQRLEEHHETIEIIGDVDGQVVIRRQLKRRHVLAFFGKLPPCLVGLEACASSHHCIRKIPRLGQRL